MHVLHVWDRCFILQARSYRAGAALGQPAFHRLSATLLVANRAPFQLSVNGQPPLSCQAVLIAPNVARDSIEGLEADVSVLDAGITTTAYERLKTRLPQGQPMQRLEDEVCAQLQALLRPGFGTVMECAAAQELFDQAVRIVVPQPQPQPPPDPRVAAVLRVVAGRTLEELSVAALAAGVGLSDARLRALFQKHFGCSLAQYIRWASAWKAIRAWREGRTLTQVAHEAGFHDLAHADRVLRELFGNNPTELIKTQAIHFRKCDW